MRKLVDEVAAAAGIMFVNRPRRPIEQKKTCWPCYQKWSCSGRVQEAKPKLQPPSEGSCPVCGSKDLRSDLDRAD